MTTTTIESVVSVERNASITLNEPITEIDDEQWEDPMIDMLSPDELMAIYMEAWGSDDDDEMPPIVARRCTECFMMIDEFEEHHCIRR